MTLGCCRYNRRHHETAAAATTGNTRDDRTPQSRFARVFAGVFTTSVRAHECAAPVVGGVGGRGASVGGCGDAAAVISAV